MAINNEACDVVRHVAITGNVLGLDEDLVERCLAHDYIIVHSKGGYGTRPGGRAMLKERIAQDQRAVQKLIS